MTRHQQVHRKKPAHNPPANEVDIDFNNSNNDDTSPFQYDTSTATETMNGSTSDCVSKSAPELMYNKSVRELIGDRSFISKLLQDDIVATDVIDNNGNVVPFSIDCTLVFWGRDRFMQQGLILINYLHVTIASGLW